MYKEDLALNNLQLLICHKTQPNEFGKVSKMVSIVTQSLEYFATIFPSIP